MVELHVNNRVASTCGHVHNVTTSHFVRKETKFVSNKTAIYRRNRSYVCLVCVKLALVCVLCVCTDLSHTQVQAVCMPWMQAVAPSPSYNRDGSEKVRTFDKRTHRHKPCDIQKICERLVVPTRSTARSCRSMSAYGRVLAASSRVLAARSEPVYFFRSNFCRFRSKFA